MFSISKDILGIFLAVRFMIADRLVNDFQCFFRQEDLSHTSSGLRPIHDRILLRNHSSDRDMIPFDIGILDGTQFADPKSCDELENYSQACEWIPQLLIGSVVLPFLT